VSFHWGGAGSGSLNIGGIGGGGKRIDDGELVSGTSGVLGDDDDDDDETGTNGVSAIDSESNSDTSNVGANS